MATGHTSAGGALKLSPPCLAFRLAARSVDAANMEEAEMKSKVEGAGVTTDHITVLGMRDFQPVYAAQLRVCLGNYNTSLYDIYIKEVSMEDETHGEKQLCVHAGGSDNCVSCSEGGGGCVLSSRVHSCLDDHMDALDAEEPHLDTLDAEELYPVTEGVYFLTSPAQGLTSRSGGQGGSQGSRTPSTLTEEELESRKQGSSPVKIPQPLHAKFLMKED